mmetsp:Transcript_116249/g.369925  ORF Transcript_116249/g.369925 Transcript_116249/m.369925 type:complete len:436 (-) Transcript_116249:89-1396(-)
MLPLAAPLPPRWAFVLYQGQGAPLWHQRLRLEALQGSLEMREIILTPDGDIYDEVLMKEHADIAAVRFATASWPPPLGISRPQVYRFQAEPSDQELAAALDSAQAVARVLWSGEHGGAIPVGEALVPIEGLVVVEMVAPPPLVVESPRSVLSDGRRGQLRALRGDVHEDPRPYDGFVWALDEDLAGPDWKKGKVVTLPPGSFGDQQRAIGPASMAAGHAGLTVYRSVDPAATPRAVERDARILPVKFDAQGERYRVFQEAVSMMSADELPGGFGLEGPRTLLPLLKSFVQQGGSPELSHMEWKRNSAVPSGDRAVYEDEALCLALQFLSTIDQINVPNLKGCELMGRRIQLIREACRISPSAPDFSASDHFMGWGRRRGGGAAQQSLTSYVADQLRTEASIAKESRKAREEKNLRAHRPNSKGKGKGKGEGAEEK